MISEYLFKGIDNVFHNRGIKPKTKQNHKLFNKQLIKANLHTVIKGKNQNSKDISPMKKSRLRTIIDKNRETQLRGVVRRDNSRSPSPYQRISTKINTPKNEQKFDKITYYREQRKTIQKSRVLEKSRIGTSNSRIFRINSQINIEDQKSRTPKRGQIETEQEVYQYKNTAKYGFKAQSFSPI